MRTGMLPALETGESLSNGLTGKPSHPKEFLPKPHTYTSRRALTHTIAHLLHNEGKPWVRPRGTSNSGISSHAFVLAVSRLLCVPEPPSLEPKTTPQRGSSWPRLKRRESAVRFRRLLQRGKYYPDKHPSCRKQNVVMLGKKKKKSQEHPLASDTEHQNATIV